MKNSNKLMKLNFFLKDRHTRLILLKLTGVIEKVMKDHGWQLLFFFFFFFFFNYE